MPDQYRVILPKDSPKVNPAALQQAGRQTDIFFPFSKNSG